MRERKKERERARERADNKNHGQRRDAQLVLNNLDTFFYGARV